MKILKSIFILLTILFVSTFFSSVVRASFNPPFPPFSVEGNPEGEYYFGELFPLLRYISAEKFEVYENRDMDRTYLHLEICGKENNPPGHGCGPFDWRSCTCDESGEGCDPGPVGWCIPNTTSQVMEGVSGGSCKRHYDEYGNFTHGTCTYGARPKIKSDVKGTDFANPNGLTYPKIQSDSLQFDNIGTDNTITWGSHYLLLDQNQLYINRLLVLVRANQSKETHTKTGEWPLGWVDWGYKTKNGKTLIQIYSELPSELTSIGAELAQSQDDFLLNIFDDNYQYSSSNPNLDSVFKIINANLSNPPRWLIDFLQSPIYPPSFRQGYVRGSICVFDICCPTSRCKVEPTGTSRALYYDTSISQSYAASLNELFFTYPLQELKSIIQNIAKDHPLIRFASSASKDAVPSSIKKTLIKDLKGECISYNPWNNWHTFGTYMDYWKPGSVLGPNGSCPGYTIKTGLEKETALATNTTPIEALIDYLWVAVDNTVPVTYHLLTIPDALGQMIQEVRQPNYDSRDTVAELKKVSKYNSQMNNIVQDNKENLYGGKTIDPADAKRRFSGYYTCYDPMFSSQLNTTVEAYALGTRVGCSDPPPLAGKCKGSTKFAQIISDSPWKKVSDPAKSLVMNSAMFVNGQLNPKLEEAYATAEKETGVPCEVLAGLHMSEASANFLSIGDPEKRSNANGQPLENGQKLVDTSTIAGKALLRHPINNTQQLVTAISNFNGGGNSNCQLGFPATIPWNGCPRQFIGEDDPYATNILDARHTNMYLLYCGDFTPCIPPKPYGNDRPGAFTTSLIVHEYLSARAPGYTPTNSDSTTPSTRDEIARGVAGFTPETCGEGKLATALGCLPYTTTAFAITLLRFLAGISGGIALAVMLTAILRIMTASGDAKQLQSGKELFTSAILGLLTVLFSVTLLRFFASNILKLPGF